MPRTLSPPPLSKKADVAYLNGRKEQALLKKSELGTLKIWLEFTKSWKEMINDPCTGGNYYLNHRRHSTIYSTENGDWITHFCLDSIINETDTKKDTIVELLTEIRDLMREMNEGIYNLQNN